ncbi:MAG: DEAD/DEAH box helicase [Sphingomonadaceae bacterium]|nr:DEAD/DEAH box helicase [Sphingomonadaceae bacterium]
MSFDQLGLSEPVLRALAAKSYATPTPIQRQAIPPLRAGRDLLGIAQTGTGKTAAFVLPSIDRLVAANKRPAPFTCRMLVLAPTRELASQIAESAKAYGKFVKLSVGTVFGGTSIAANRRTVERGIDILVATPGRMLDLVDQRLLSLKDVEIFVLDEADQMLDLGFIHALRRTISLLPKQRQTLFFSATMPAAIKELADKLLTQPEQVVVTPVASATERVEQHITFVNQPEKQALLTLMLQQPEVERALVFSRTKHGADKVVKLLGANGVAANAIHGNKSQPQRERALAEFKSGKTPVLVATDIAARGIDVSGVSHVFNFDLPEVPEQYVHRIGRTGRADATGVAYAFCSEDERGLLRQIEKLTRKKVPVQPLPERFLERASQLVSRAPASPQSEQPQRRPHQPRPPAKRFSARPAGAGAGAGAGAQRSGRRRRAR